MPAMMRPSQRPVRRGFTLIEVVVVIAIAMVIIALAAPAFTRMIEMQRLRGVNAQLVTDVQFARSEAISRNTIMRVMIGGDSTQTCYTIYTSSTDATRCDCKRGVGTACTGTMQEVKTVSVPVASKVRIDVSAPDTLPPPVGYDFAFAFNPTTGGLLSIPSDFGPGSVDPFRIDAHLDNERKLQTWIERSGRPSVCRPAGSTMPEDACIPPTP